jgi:hypothetical protein
LGPEKTACVADVFLCRYDPNLEPGSLLRALWVDLGGSAATEPTRPIPSVIIVGNLGAETGPKQRWRSASTLNLLTVTET